MILPTRQNLNLKLKVCGLKKCFNSSKTFKRDLIYKFPPIPSKKTFFRSFSKKFYKTFLFRPQMKNKLGECKNAI